jgi:hypothetical protein
MLSNNDERLKIIMGMVNQFDYDLFKAICETSAIIPLGIAEYAQKVGMLNVGMVKSPDLSPADAYMKIVAIMNEEYQKQSQKVVDPNFIPNPDKRDCGGCGGGQVR